MVAVAETAMPARREPRRRILDAAAACFSRNGFHATSMQEVCAAAKMSPGALYRYFPSKEAIIAALVEEERAQRTALLAHLDTAPGFVEAIVAMGRDLFAGPSMVCVELSPEISAEAVRNPRLREMFDEAEGEMLDVLREALLAAQARGEVDPALDPDLVMLVINAIGDGLILHHRLEPDMPLAEMMPALGKLIARMLAPPAGTMAPRAPRTEEGR